MEGGAAGPGSLSHPLRIVSAMETCEYCDDEIPLHRVTLVAADGHEWQGTCARCGHVVSHVADPPRSVPRRRAA